MTRLKGLPGRCRTAAAGRTAQASSHCLGHFVSLLQVPERSRGLGHPSQLSPLHSASGLPVSSADELG